MADTPTTRLVSVQVFDYNGTGTTVGVITALELVLQQHVAGQLALVNMSLGGGASDALDAAVNSLKGGLHLAAVESSHEVHALCRPSLVKGLRSTSSQTALMAVRMSV